MLVNKTVEFFLSEAAGWSGMPARAEAGTGSETKLRVYCCEKQDGTGGGAGDQITWAGSGLGAARDRTRYRRRPRLGPGQDAVGGRGLGRDKMPAGAEAEQAAGSERPGTGRDAGGGRGRDWDKMPATKSPGRQRARSGPGLGRDTGGDRG